MTVSELQAKLEIYVGAKRALALAQATVDNMASIKFAIRESHFTHPEIWKRIGKIPQAEYSLPKNQFDINSSNGSTALEGSFLTVGNLLRLAQCVEIGRQYLPTLWPNYFGTRLRGAEHLDALNEVWWLKLWRGIMRVNRGPKVSENLPDFEWEIEVQDAMARCIINLEVKLRTGNINKLFKENRPTASVRKISNKFGDVPDHTANIAALTIYHPIPAEIERGLNLWLEDQEHLHGLLLWTEGSMDMQPLQTFIKQSHKWVEFLLKEPDPEDMMIAGHSIGTLCEVEQVHDFLNQITKQIRNQK